MPEISVIIPVYNVEKYLSRCLDSLKKQTFPNWEAVCVDDGSTDGSGAVLDSYAAEDARLKVIHQKNGGLSVARNNGLSAANGRYVYFLDSDDFMHPQLLETVHGLAKKYGAQLVCFESYNEKKEEFKVQPVNPEKVKVKITDKPLFWYGKHGRYKIHFNVWTKFYARDLLEGISFIPGIRYEDYPHTFAVLSKNPHTVITPEKLYYYSFNGNSISNEKVSPSQIRDYRTGLRYIYGIYKYSGRSKELAFLKRTLIPSVLKQQLKKCERTGEECREQMFAEFTAELKELDSKHLITLCGNDILRYLSYKKLIRGQE